MHRALGRVRRAGRDLPASRKVQGLRPEWRGKLRCTGADTCVFPQQVATDLEIPVRDARGPAITAFGGQAVPTKVADVEVELSDGDTTLRWTMRAFFHAASEEEVPVLILGHAGFLEFFTTTFIGDECILELVENEYLPLIPQSDS